MRWLIRVITLAVLMDENLEPEMDGIQAMQKIKKNKPNLPVIIITGNKDYEESPDYELFKQAYAVMTKPISENQLQEILNNVKNFMLSSVNGESIDNTYKKTLIGENETQKFSFYNADAMDELNERLALLKKVTKADACALFKMNLGTREVSLVAKANIDDNNFDRVRRELRVSPVRDIAEDKKIIYENNVEADRKFDKMKGLTNFKSCIGVPLIVTGRDRYALFVFHSNQNYFINQYLETCKLTSYILSLILEKEKQSKAINKARGILIMGQLISGLIHDLRHPLQAITSSITVAEMASKSKNESEMIRGLESVKEACKQLNDSLDYFISALTGGNTDYADVKKVIKNAIETVKPSATILAVEVRDDLAYGVPSARISETALQHVIMNLLVNAIQQIADIEKVKNGWVKIDLDYVESDDLPIKIRVSDNGPGIHKRDMEEVFEMSFTTKPQGMGLGLYLCREILKLAGGRISIEKSIIFIGTTFLVELSVYKKQ